MFSSTISRISVLFFTLVLTLSSFINALPIERRDVWVPPILNPTSGTIWTIGTRQNVTWDTVNGRPVNVTNYNGHIHLRKEGRTNLTALAEGFNLTVGTAEITVPEVAPGSGYQIVLFGDSGNFSPEFEIVAA